MASPGIVQVAIALSVATTGGAMYYYLTDGGDAQVAQEKIDGVKERLVFSSERLQSESATYFEDVKNFFERARETVSKASVDVFSNRDVQSSASGSSINAETADSPSSDAGNKPQNVRDRPFCHTCSGPRIWFFAEKLRLKRRFTPYPDPPRE